MKGFTLMEMILVIAVLAIIFGFSTPFLTNFINRQNLDSVAEELISVLRIAQNKAIMAEKDSFWGVDFSEEKKYILFSDPRPRGLSAPTKQEYLLSKNISLTINNYLLEFEKLTGQLNQSAEIILTIGKQRYRIFVNQEGTIDYYKD